MITWFLKGCTVRPHDHQTLLSAMHLSLCISLPQHCSSLKLKPYRQVFPFLSKHLFNLMVVTARNKSEHNSKDAWENIFAKQQELSFCWKEGATIVRLKPYLRPFLLSLTVTASGMEHLERCLSKSTEVSLISDIQVLAFWKQALRYFCFRWFKHSKWSDTILGSENTGWNPSKNSYDYQTNKNIVNYVMSYSGNAGQREVKRKGENGSGQRVTILAAKRTHTNASKECYRHITVSYPLSKFSSSVSLSQTSNLRWCLQSSSELAF